MRHLIAAVVVSALALAAGCSLAEWQEVGTQAAQELPERVGQVLADPSPVNLILQLSSYLGALAAGWYGRKYGVKYANVRPYNGMGADNPRLTPPPPDPTKAIKVTPA